MPEYKERIPILLAYANRIDGNNTITDDWDESTNDAEKLLDLAEFFAAILEEV